MRVMFLLVGLSCCCFSARAQRSDFTFTVHSFLAQNKDTASGATAPGTGNQPEEVKDRYRVVQVDSITVQPDVEFPAEYLTHLQSEVGNELVQQKEFEEVIVPGQSPSHAGAPTLRLRAEITAYKPGSRAERYIVGWGAGSTEVYAKILFLDGDTGRTLVAEDLRAQLMAGLFGGPTEGIVKDFARQIVVMTKLMLVRRLPGPNQVEAGVETSKSFDTTGSDAAERRTLTISGKGEGWIPAQQELDDWGAAGFRVMGLTLKGKSGAEVLLQKMPSAPQAYTYKLLHTLRPGSMEKDMNSASADGFRAVENTLAQWDIGLSVIMEKSQILSQTRYQYLVNHAMRISSSQKNTEKYQADGYSLIGNVERDGANLLLFEKPMEEKK